MLCSCFAFWLCDVRGPLLSHALVEVGCLATWYACGSLCWRLGCARDYVDNVFTLLLPAQVRAWVDNQQFFAGSLRCVVTILAL
jgi:hypothetical protein